MTTSLIKTRVAQKLGTVSALNAPVVFGIPDSSFSYGGELTLMVTGGGVTTPVWMLACSIDNGVSWFNLSPSSTGLVNTGGFSGDTAATYIAQYSTLGLAGSLFKFGLTQGTGITAMTIWAMVG